MAHKIFGLAYDRQSRVYSSDCGRFITYRVAAVGYGTKSGFPVYELMPGIEMRAGQSKLIGKFSTLRDARECIRKELAK